MHWLSSEGRIGECCQFPDTVVWTINCSELPSATNTSGRYESQQPKNPWSFKVPAAGFPSMYEGPIENGLVPDILTIGNTLCTVDIAFHLIMLF